MLARRGLMAVEPLRCVDGHGGACEGCMPTGVAMYRSQPLQETATQDNNSSMCTSSLLSLAHRSMEALQELKERSTVPTYVMVRTDVLAEHIQLGTSVLSWVPSSPSAERLTSSGSLVKQSLILCGEGAD